MGTVTPIRNDVLPAPILVYQRKGFIECEPDDADGYIEHTQEGEKRHWLRGDGIDFLGTTFWWEVRAREYLEALK